jgi:adenylate cyclase
MQTIDEGLLTQALLHLLQEQGLATGSSQTAFEEIVRLAIARSGSIARPSESRDVTILLSDLRGFTATTERHSAIAMVEALNRYLEKMSEIILRHGGSIDKFMGDSIMALFGAPDSLHNDIEAALRCAIEMQTAMADINAVNQALGMTPLFMGIGINTGEVIAGHLGSRYHSEYTVIGDEVNLASRVEAHSLRGQILLSEKIYVKAKDFIKIGRVNEVFMKGKKSVVRMVELLGVTSAPAVEVPAGDTRIGPRVEVDMPLSFQVIEDKSVLPNRISGRIVDISYGGMYIQSNTEVPLFCDIKMVLSLSLLVQEHADVYGKVLRMTAVADGFEYRIEFTSIDVQAQSALKEFVDRLVEIK